MRLWSVHPQLLDRIGLVALWREGLLAQAVLAGKTRGYRHHPQLTRFKAAPDPVAALGSYLAAVVAEADRRGYAFKREKILRTSPGLTLTVAAGQMAYEWEHLLRKLQARSPTVWAEHAGLSTPPPHPLFQVVEGPIEAWERVSA